MNLGLRFIPFFIGAGIVYLVTKNIMGFDKTIKFIITSITMASLCYFFVAYNIWMMKRTGELSEKKALAPNHLGHLVIFIGALCAGYGFIENNQILILVSLGFIVYADTLLTKTKLIGVNRNQATLNKVVDPKEDALMRAINNQKKEDPLVGLKIGSNEVTQRLLEALKNEKGVHIESLLAIIGSLAGYSCHAALREELVASSKMTEKEAFKIVSCKDGKNYYFGDLPNKPLAEDKYSIWSLVAGTTQHLGGELYDIKSTFSNSVGAMGSEYFGIPQVPEQHRPNDIPLNYVKSLWPALLPIIDKFCSRPMERPILLGLVAQKAIEMGKEVIPPAIAAKLVMECAVPMSKIGPEWLA